MRGNKSWTRGTKVSGCSAAKQFGVSVERQGMGILGQRANILSRASLIAGIIVWLICGPNSRSLAANDERPADASAAEQRLLGDDDEATRFAACQPFTREIAVEGAVEGSFEATLAAAGMPAAEMLGAQRGLP